MPILQPISVLLQQDWMNRKIYKVTPYFLCFFLLYPLVCLYSMCVFVCGQQLPVCMCLLVGAEDDAASTIRLHKNVQKKLVPWHAMIPEQDLASELRQKRQEGLIVVASLIDCLPNLGGLCRTCEGFGVSEYVVGSLKSTEDKQFRSLSVSAEQWIPISEVGRLNQVYKLKAIINKVFLGNKIYQFRTDVQHFRNHPRL